jgi:hypothetical protein
MELHTKRQQLLQIRRVKGLKREKFPAVVMWYLPVRDGMIRHPTDGRQWKHFDLSHENFSNNPRNIRFGLNTNGMNPFGEMRNPHST